MKMEWHTTFNPTASLMRHHSPLLPLLLTLSCFAIARAAGEEQIAFETHVRPVLKAHCWQCHGEEEKREGELDLRLARLILKGGDSGAAIIAGKAGESRLMQRVTSGEMPPGEKKLSPKEIDILRRWISSGAKTVRAEPKSPETAFVTEEDRQFWSFQSVRRPAIPNVRSDRIQNAIDSFVVRRLQEKGLALSTPANRVTLARRLFLDLTGLPPTPDQMARFVNDKSPNAYESLVEELLASPRYGERWGRHWLDVAGYADSEGYTEKDPVRKHAYHYRDYVIRAFNSDRPYSEFIQEQLAGDEMITSPLSSLSPRDVRRVSATGFLRMAPDGTASPGVNQGLARNEAIAGTMEIVSTSLLGLTVGCARCHNHRYDPISQLDYYRFRAIFDPALDWQRWKSPAARRISLYTTAERKKAQEIEVEAKKIEAKRQKRAEFFIERTLTEELATLDETLRRPLRTAYRTTASKRTPEQKQLLKENPSVASISVGSLYLYDRRREQRARKLDQERAAKLAKYLDQVRDNAIKKVAAEERAAVQQALRAKSKRTAAQLKLLSKHPAVLVSEATLAQFAPQAAAEIHRLKTDSTKLRQEKAADELKQFTARAAEIRATIPKELFLRALTETPGQIPSSFLFVRGDHEQPKQQVQPSELDILSKGPPLAANNPKLATSGRRLAYATQLTSGKHPLVARVMVNRMWSHHFGQGLVRSLGDFGRLGRRPTHPELLDWLASEFVRNDWSIKHVHRLMVTSATYRQSSRRTPKLDQVDPDNRLYGRMTIRRIESEVLRDSILSVSGALNDKMFGEPVPVMEDGVGQIVIGKENLDGERKPVNPIDMRGEQYRRSIYVQARRSRPLAVLETFDTPAMSPNCTQRNASNAAPQSLLLMNSPFILDYSRRFAQRVQRESGASVESQIRRAWLLAFSTEPTKQQTADAASYLAEQRVQFAKSAAASVELDALTSLCQALFSANQFIYVD